MSNKISIVILTFKMTKHIKRCIGSIKDITQEIYAVDSFSTYKTVEFAKSLGAIVCHNHWENYADDFITPELAKEIHEELSQDYDTKAFNFFVLRMGSTIGIVY